MKWQQYVASHQQYEAQLLDCKAWMAGISKKLAYCSDFSAFTLADQEDKLTTLQVSHRVR